MENVLDIRFYIILSSVKFIYKLSVDTRKSDECFYKSQNIKFSDSIGNVYK